MNWMEMEVSNPSRSDLYAMQIACEVRRVLSKNPNSIKLKDFLLTTERSKPSPNLPSGNSTAMAKAIWRARLSGKKYRVIEPLKPAEEKDQ